MLPLWRIIMSNTKKTTRKSPLRKKPFDVEEALRRLRRATAPYPKAALFEPAAEGHNSVFEILVACIISIRTFDEVTLPVARRLFAKARTPSEVATLAEAEIDELIRPCTFHEPKAKTIRAIARQTVEEYGGALPSTATRSYRFGG